MISPMQSNPDATIVRPPASEVRLRKHADYQRVYKATRKQFSASLTWFMAARPASDISAIPRVGITAGKVLGKAHERNRIKRRLREIIRRNLHELPEHADLILHPRRSVMAMDFVKLEAEVVRIFRQANAQSRNEARKPILVAPPANPPVAP